MDPGLQHRRSWGAYSLVTAVGLEVVGILLVLTGVVELNHLGNNPFHGSSLIAVGSLLVAFSSLWFARLLRSDDPNAV